MGEGGRKGEREREREREREKTEGEREGEALLLSEAFVFRTSQWRTTLKLDTHPASINVANKGFLKVIKRFWKPRLCA